MSCSVMEETLLSEVKRSKSITRPLLYGLYVLYGDLVGDALIMLDSPNSVTRLTYAVTDLFQIGDQTCLYNQYSMFCGCETFQTRDNCAHLIAADLASALGLIVESKIDGPSFVNKVCLM
ncbi:hypothetical protein MIR68_007347 [Amoeboaphelidium protococcarum]|nr:hypothetical protein MIR68_007347 [Amoeboaphelidium protococcarum]